MSEEWNGAGSGAATGAASGAIAGSAFGPVGTVVGGVGGGVVGGVSGYFQGRALGKSEAAAKEAQRRLEQARVEYGIGTDRINSQSQGEYDRLANEQLRSQRDQIASAPTGAQDARTLQSTYAGALQGAQKAGQRLAPPAPTGAHGGLSQIYAGEATSRAGAEMQQQAQAMAINQVQQNAQIAAQTHGLDQMKLNRQLAYVANVSGVEKAGLAARYAAATGQYPLDMAEAGKAGGRDALIGGSLQGLLNLGTSASSAFGGSGNAPTHAQGNVASTRSPSMTNDQARQAYPGTV